MSPLLEAAGVCQTFRTGHGRRAHTVVALDQVSLAVDHGEIVGLVGESGSGKSTLARVICGLQPYDSGSVRLDGQVLTARRTRPQRRAVQLVFQDPYASLDPRMTIRQTLAEMLTVHRLLPKDRIRSRCQELMELVQLPGSLLDARPGGMSGGQRQRVAIARALSVDPRVLVADEAVAALDVSVQAGVINLLDDLRHELGLAILFIAHDLAVVRSLCDRVSVIHRGRIVEERPTAALFAAPENDYTRRLLAAVPRLDGQRTVGLGAAYRDRGVSLEQPDGCDRLMST
ncbi:MAG: ABC transporter ATP-binding protein [Microlunatus sp.]|nr:ABC transporter ATP-binding protein [Microlunatus sp.]